MSKYIIEFEEKPLCVFDKDTQTYFPRLWRVKGFNSLVFDKEGLSRLEELNSNYINQHYSTMLQDEYDKGYKDGRNVTETQAHDDAYQRGLDDAWEAARKLFSSMADSDIEKAFPTEWNNGGFNALINLQPQEAIAKLKAYEKKQKADDEIKVGDEVYACMPNGKTQPFIIIKIYDEDGVKYYSGINADGNHVQGGLNYIKTGRHFPHVAELLKEMQS